MTVSISIYLQVDSADKIEIIGPNIKKFITLQPLSALPQAEQ